MYGVQVAGFSNVREIYRCRSISKKCDPWGREVGPDRLEININFIGNQSVLSTFRVTARIRRRGCAISMGCMESIHWWKRIDPVGSPPQARHADRLGQMSPPPRCESDNGGGTPSSLIK